MEHQPWTPEQLGLCCNGAYVSWCKWRHGSEAVIGLSTSANVASLCSVPNDPPQTVDSGDLGCFSLLFEGEKVVGHFPRRT